MDISGQVDVRTHWREIERLDTLGDWKRAGELAFAVAQVAQDEGDQVNLDLFGRRALEIYENHATETGELLGAAPSQQCLRIGAVEVPLPNWLHAGVVSQRLSLSPA